MNVLLLSPHSKLATFLESFGEHVVITEEKITSSSIVLETTNFIISYGYRHILKPDVITRFPLRIINIHISLLPWNRGADPNLWSFLEDTPKGVTIHYIDEGIDTGDILVQQSVDFSTCETLRTSYEKLSCLAVRLFQQSWQDIRAGKITPRPQALGGSFHRTQDRQPYDYLLTEGWDTPVIKLVGKALPIS